MQANPELERNFRSTVRGLVGAGFTDEEISKLEERALDRVKAEDLTTLHGLEAGVPVTLTTKQKAKIGEMLGRMGSDPLSLRARQAFEESIRNGKIRIR